MGIDTTTRYYHLCKLVHNFVLGSFDDPEAFTLRGDVRRDLTGDVQVLQSILATDHTDTDES